MHAPASRFPLPASRDQSRDQSRDIAASYDAVAYDSRPIHYAEPDALAAIATLHGLTPPSPSRCRVLELGCATGMNLVSMAFRMPKSKFVGIDLAPNHIESGRFIVSELGLQNVDLQLRSIADIGEADGLFDYIICHGVFSWVPPNVQDAILRVCSQNLSEHGIAYVSYNTYPGWHRRGMLRDMLLFHDDPSLDPAERVARAREFASAIAASDPTNDTAHFAVLREEAKELEKQRDVHLFHEQLEPWNEPIYFSEFMRRASTNGLAYVADSHSGVESAAMAKLREKLGENFDHLRMEQYIDFVRGRPFRRSVLCHAAAKPTPEAVANGVHRLMIRARVASAEASPEDAARGPGVTSFQTPEGVKVTTNNPLVIAILTALMDATPEAVPFDDLRRRVSERFAASRQTSDVDDEALASALLACTRGAFVEFRVLPSPLVSRPGLRPKASTLARWQALSFEEVTTLAHSYYKLVGIERFLIAHLDGTKDRAQLVRHTEHAFTSGDLTLPGFVPTSESLAAIVDEVLGRLARAGLLVA